MSGMVHRDNIEVRPLEEELKDLGLNPEKVVNEIERQSGLLATRQVASASGLQEGDKTPRSLKDVGQQLVEQKGEKAPLGSGERFQALSKELAAKGAKNPEALAAWIGRKKYGKEKMAKMAAAGESVEGTENAEQVALTEVTFKQKKKLRGSKVRIQSRKRHKRYLTKRGTELKASRKRQARFGTKIAAREKMKEKKFGGAKGLAKLHQKGRRVVAQQPLKKRRPAKREWSDQIANLREELLGITETQDKVSLYGEAVGLATMLAEFLGEIFDAVGDQESGQLLLGLAKVADGFYDEMESVEEPTEEQEAKLSKILEGIIKSYAIYEEMGCPSLYEAILFSEQENGEDEEDGEDEDEEDGEDEGDGEEPEGGNGKRERNRGGNGSGCKK